MRSGKLLCLLRNRRSFPRDRHGDVVTDSPRAARPSSALPTTRAHFPLSQGQWRRRREGLLSGRRRMPPDPLRPNRNGGPPTGQWACRAAPCGSGDARRNGGELQLPKASQFYPGSSVPISVVQPLVEGVPRGSAAPSDGRDAALRIASQFASPFLGPAPCGSVARGKARH